MNAKRITAAIFLVFFLALPSVWAGSVTRGFSSSSLNPGEQLTVTLAVDVNSSETYFAIDETYPTGWTLDDDGGMLNSSHPYHLKNVTVEYASDVQFVYILTAPSQTGTHTWSGIYMLENMGEEQSVLGTTQVTVSSPSPPPEDNGEEPNGNGDTGGNGEVTPPVCTEGDTRPCSIAHEGRCAEGDETCHSNVWSGCPQTVDEVCNGIDDDCDGETDEDAGCCTTGEERQCGPSTDEGLCEFGVSKCINDIWGDCEGDVMPGIEICDGSDNDCNGEVDEECASDTCEEGFITPKFKLGIVKMPQGCICDGDVRTSGYCCGGLYYESGCPFPWSILIYAGIVILIVLYALFFYFRSKGRELTWDMVKGRDESPEGSSDV